jgi:succinoglycan biosynthesis protein ExoO
MLHVSVIMANYRGRAYLAQAVASVLRQTHARLELLVADDASPDDSLAMIRGLARHDARIKVLASDTNLGPAASRNRALDAATGDWVAIMDSDDLMHPARLSRLLAAAQTLNADMVADDMVFFGTSPGTGGRTLLQPLALRAPMRVDATLLLRSSGEDVSLPALGYLKPLIRRSVIGGLRYDTSLRIAEDYDFYLRLLLEGAQFSVLADPMYLYRRHGASISHRLSVEAVQAMCAAHADLVLPPESPQAAHHALAARSAGLADLLAYETLVVAIKARKPLDAARLLLRQPALLRPLVRSLRERNARKALVTAPERVSATLTLTDGFDEGAGMLRVPVPPMPGHPWAEPPAPVAARLSDLISQQDLHLTLQGGAGAAWFAGLVPGQGDLHPASGQRHD